MKGLDNHVYVILLVISNIVAILQLIAAIKWPRIARLSFFLLFAWASWTNWTESLRAPQFYLCQSYLEQLVQKFYQRLVC